ncbi:MAG TPA: zf-HC2 domain-containing protein [Thermoanaerobaculia bacterium]|jgi:hypothetical protein
MKRHISTEQLSAYLDQELGFAEMRQLEAHCSVCGECNARRASMRRVVDGLGVAQRAVPPAALKQQIRRQAMAEAPARGLGRALEWLRLRLFPLQPALRTAAAMGLALVVGLSALNHLSTGPGPKPGPAHEVVTVDAYLDGPVMQTTTSEVAGREFVWTEAGWVQRGLEGKTPEARLDSGSPRGRELLTRYSDLEFLLADGSSVVLRYKLETVEIRNAAPNRILGHDSHPRPGRHHQRLLAA